jgi:homopolymeric O-antigen transport system ATP-binding protein
MRGRAAALLEAGTGFDPELTGRENSFLNASVLPCS